MAHCGRKKALLLWEPYQAEGGHKGEIILILELKRFVCCCFLSVSFSPGTAVDHLLQFSQRAYISAISHANSSATV